VSAPPRRRRMTRTTSLGGDTLRLTPPRQSARTVTLVMGWPFSVGGRCRTQHLHDIAGGGSRSRSRCRDADGHPVDLALARKSGRGSSLACSASSASTQSRRVSGDRSGGRSGPTEGCTSSALPLAPKRGVKLPPKAGQRARVMPLDRPGPEPPPACSEPVRTGTYLAFERNASCELGYQSDVPGRNPPDAAQSAAVSAASVSSHRGMMRETQRPAQPRAGRPR
jgi:hypothetical protein